MSESQTTWITDGRTQKLWPADRPIPQGWIRGQFGAAAFSASGKVLGKKQPGPAKGSGRHRSADMALLPDMERLIAAGRSPHGAALTLAHEGKIANDKMTEPESLARRLVKLYNEIRRN